MAEMTQEKQIKDLLARAKKCPNKGRYYVYEQYKSELRDMNLSAGQYEQICRQLSNALGV